LLEDEDVPAHLLDARFTDALEVVGAVDKNAGNQVAQTCKGEGGNNKITGGRHLVTVIHHKTHGTALLGGTCELEQEIHWTVRGNSPQYLPCAFLEDFPQSFLL